MANPRRYGPDTDVETRMVSGRELAAMEQEAEDLDGEELEEWLGAGGGEEEASNATERIALYLEPARLPRLELTDGLGVKRYRTVGLAELLTLLDHSSVLEALEQAAIRTTTTPELPERTLFAGVIETPVSADAVATGWLPPRRQAFVWQDRTYLVDLPVLVWKARMDGDRRRLRSLRVAVAGPGTERAEASTPLYRWPFANVYASRSYAEVCWYTMRDVELDLKDAVRLGVEGFLSVRDNGDLFGVGESQNSPHRDYAEFLEAVSRDGLPRDWLIPHGLTVKEFHERRYDVG